MEFAIEVASQLGLVVISPEYHLAPEFPYPHGLNDCLSVYSWLDSTRGYLADAR